MNNQTQFSVQLEAFHQLHMGTSPLVLVNVWDAASAMIVQASGAKALATSSASLAWSLGYADGGELPIDALLSAVANIVRVSQLPVTVDIENGYSDKPEEVVSLVDELVNLGVVGINIEDGEQSTELLVAKITAIRASASCGQVFINARTDVYLRGLAEHDEALDMCKSRLTRYQAAGADCGFIPGIDSEHIASRLGANLAMPLNFMLAGDHLAVSKRADTLLKLGVTRFSIGPGSFLDAYSTLKHTSKPSKGSCKDTEQCEQLNYNEMNTLVMRAR
ncbi:isocitrate lyase/phosphoenolpyruvate mutase family protein [Shewanella eurypsychrophilus]|uniref:Isocitrate lyase/phosphoenolpyruvate mutase family protein n=1 Tax=Shewanella eurypsychrophilus TaxID=2593656 RepID=A0ABX6VAP9_9GAMM|nr:MULTISPECIES: isocitrate lyase/phosphoenolpyruvate mutase family protein [Shewanella]QFU24555.1 isocitrate lyase/phosphoenolpyruvate mutase family protein [Shewanella sp. YLB-09]QPG59751.1 isocitrate lyase/phosphoenolpyruvate mutase family protein [Shewanella eurypsychrophilus]